MDVHPLDVLKWIGIVLAAGFVGYFGRYLAMLVLEEVHRKKESAPPPMENGRVEPDRDGRLEVSRIKLEKKKAKQAAKQAKKAGR